MVKYVGFNRKAALFVGFCCEGLLLLFFFSCLVATVDVLLGVYYSLAVWRFKPILSAGLQFHSHLSGGLRLRNYPAVAGNQKFSSRFSVFTRFCGCYSNRVKRHRRLSGNFILLKASLFKKGLSFRARPSQSGLPSALKDRL